MGRAFESEGFWWHLRTLVINDGVLVDDLRVGSGNEHWCLRVVGKETSWEGPARHGATERNHRMRATMLSYLRPGLTTSLLSSPSWHGSSTWQEGTRRRGGRSSVGDGGAVQEF